MKGQSQKKISLIALDLDGTLLDHRGTLSAGNRRALEAAMEEGIHVVIATGRVYSALPPEIFTVPGIEYVITSNGANVIRLSDRSTIYSNLIEHGSIEKIMDILEDPTIMVEVFFDHDVFAERRCLENLEAFGIVSEKSKHYTLSTRKPVDNTAELLRSSGAQLENVNLIFRDQEKRAALWKRLAAMEDLTVTSSMPFNLELGGATTSKADALTHLSGILGLSAGNIMACGDSANDLTMLRHAGLAVAMGNAEEAVKAAAHFVTKSNAEDGVAHAITQFALHCRWGDFPAEV